MKEIRGSIISEGLAIGNLVIYDRKTDGQDIEAEGKKIMLGEKHFWQARDAAIEQLKEIQKNLKKKIEETEDAEFLEVQISFLEDSNLIEDIRRGIVQDGLNAVDSLEKVCEKYKKLFLGLDNEYMRARAKDIEDALLRVRRNLLGTRMEQNLRTPSVIACVDLSPSQTAELDLERVLGIVSEKSTSYSHMAIIARMMGIPVITGIPEQEWRKLENETVIIDGEKSVLIADPDEETRKIFQEKREKAEIEKEKLKILLDKPAQTKTGKKIKLYANMAGEDDIEQILENNAEGIGLYRSEFMYVSSDTYPTEERLFAAYKNILLKMKGKTVIIRTIDIGADKAADYFGLKPEQNPAMGYRGVRICLDRKDVFKTQLRALARASKYGKLAVMFPMISDLTEVRRCKSIVDEIKQEIEGAEFETGIMIETPAAALISEQLAREVDFFSIGTNDLTQFTLAVDRMNRQLEGTYDVRHPAVLRLIEMSVKAAKQAGIWVGICGELAADMCLTEWFLELGVDELSVSGSQILRLKEKILSIE